MNEQFLLDLRSTLNESSERKSHILRDIFLFTSLVISMKYLFRLVSDTGTEQRVLFNTSPITEGDVLDEFAFVSDELEEAVAMNVDMQTVNGTDMKNQVKSAEFWATDMTVKGPVNTIEALTELPDDADLIDVIKSIEETRFGINKKTDDDNVDDVTRLGSTSGQERILRQPLLAGLYPYRAIYPTHDDRVRHTHLALEAEGLNSTNIYNADDPIWRFIIPPMYYNCRCGWDAVDIRTAADRGIQEARNWVGRAEAFVKANDISWQSAVINTKPESFEFVQIDEDKLPEVWEERYHV